ncbi:hypothetical protein J8F10_20560 [Gemmata sp. G18]|uniref:Uncharacterized protein n=1 Tax=Gemmata palustris TaxID=2822762 RepID=A0ABS5BVF5_9BACT|nr:hypothetical protein [Gemmata palustris]MBP3957649.1 hypothetical protein [Gemmata palustris]
MKLLTSVFPRSGRVLPAGGWFTLAVVVFVAGLEVAGRYATSDLHDGLGAFALVGAGVLVAVRHRREPLPWVIRLAGVGRKLTGSAAWLRYDHGIDLRGVPPLPRRTPPVVFAIIALLFVWGLVAAGAWLAFPTGWRVVGFYSSYTLYLGFMLALWGALAAVTFVGVFVPIAVLDKRLKNVVGDTDRRGAELAAIVGYAVLVATVAWVVPPVAVLVTCLVVAVVAWVAYLPPGNDGAALLWRAATDRPVFAVPLRRALAVIVGLTALLAFDILLTACGGRLFDVPRSDDTMPLTALLGTVTAWLLPGVLCVLGAKLSGARSGDPARRTPPTLHVSGADSTTVRRAVQIARAWGWFVRAAPAPREPGQVGIEVVEADASEAAEFNPHWPLKVSLADLELRAVKERLDRRDEIKVRRQLFRGLQKLFKRASAFKGPAGGGFWLAPHWWFVEGVGREDADSASEDAPPLVGPAYHRVLTARARQHAHAVLRATQVDMIFVEDGVTFRNLERALRVLTELYDVHGGKRRAEEMHFRGIPKVKAMIHEYEPGNPFRSDLYPEPKFDDLSRVRVLHIFRDRGAHEELTDQPFDFSSTPAPVGMWG